MAKRACHNASASLAPAEAASPVESTPYELAAAWAQEENENFEMLAAAQSLLGDSCPAVRALLRVVMERMRDCVPEESLLNRLSPREVAHG